MSSSSSSSNGALKSSLSQLLLRSIEQMEDPKYATVPLTQLHEFRPSILKKYQRRCDDYNDALDNCPTPTCISAAFSDGSNLSRCCDSKPLTAVRAFNWKVEPLWRYCTSKVHLELQNGSKIIVSAVKAKRTGRNGGAVSGSCASSDKSTASQATTPATATTISSSVSAEKRNLRKNKSQTDDIAKHVGASLSEDTKAAKVEDELQSQHSQPAFEVLPALYVDTTHTLLYQNSYLLDGVKYDYETNRQSSMATKLRMNYLKFLKSVNKNQKPTDRDIVFGPAQVVFDPPLHWEGSRIDWLLKLEKQQELRKQSSTEVRFIEPPLSEHSLKLERKSQKQIKEVKVKKAKVKEAKVKKAKVKKQTNEAKQTKPKTKDCQSTAKSDTSRCSGFWKCSLFGKRTSTEQ